MKQLDRFTFLLGERKKLIRVQATDLDQALTRACHRYPGQHINYTNMYRVKLFEARKILIDKIKTNKFKPMKMFSSCPENRPLIDEINNLIDERSFVLILVSDGVAYLLHNHYHYLNPETEAKRINLGNVFRTEDHTYYFYERMIIPESTQKISKPKIKDKALKIRGNKIKSSKKK